MRAGVATAVTRCVTAGTKWLAGLAVVAATFATSAPAAAQVNQELDRKIRTADGRLRGYNETDVVLEGADGGVLPYFVFALLALLATVFLFKDARRSHLD